MQRSIELSVRRVVVEPVATAIFILEKAK